MKHEAYQSFDIYMKEITRHQVLTREQELELARKCKLGDKTARTELIISNLRFVVKLANRMRGYGLKTEDLIQEGNIGLMLAADRFDPERGFRFCTYSRFWIVAKMNLYVMRNFCTVNRFGAQRDRTAFFHDYDQLCAKRDLSLDTIIGDGIDTYLDLLEVEPDQETTAMSKELEVIVRDCLKSSIQNEREKVIVNNRILGNQELTLKEIGETFGLTRECIRQKEEVLLDRTKRKLRQKLTGSHNIKLIELIRS